MICWLVFVSCLQTDVFETESKEASVGYSWCPQVNFSFSGRTPGNNSWLVNSSLSGETLVNNCWSVNLSLSGEALCNNYYYYYYYYYYHTTSTTTTTTTITTTTTTSSSTILILLLLLPLLLLPLLRLPLLLANAVTLIVAHLKTSTKILYLFRCKPSDANHHVQASDLAVLSQSQARQANSEQIQSGASISVVC